MAFNVTIRAKILENLLRCAELELKVKQFHYRPGVAQRVPGS